MHHLGPLSLRPCTCPYVRAVPQAYMWCEEGPTPQVLPARLAVPWAAVSRALDMPPVLVYATYNLYNWRRLPVQAGAAHGGTEGHGDTGSASGGGPGGPVALNNIVCLHVSPRVACAFACACEPVCMGWCRVPTTVAGRGHSVARQHEGLPESAACLPACSSPNGPRSLPRWLHVLDVLGTMLCEHCGTLVLVLCCVPQNFFGGQDEEWFRLVHVDIEAKAAAAVANIPRLQQAVQQVGPGEVGAAGLRAGLRAGL